MFIVENFSEYKELFHTTTTSQVLWDLSKYLCISSNSYSNNYISQLSLIIPI